MKLRFQPLTTEVDALIRFLTSESWDDHGNQSFVPRKSGKPSARVLHRRRRQNLLIVIDSGRKVGLIRIFDLQTPLFRHPHHPSIPGMGIGDRR